MQCEHCTNEIENDLHSMLVVLQRVDQQGYSWFQCEQGQEMDGHNWQHSHCSHAHMLDNVAACIHTHYKEDDLTRVPVTQVRLHRHVLNRGLTCAVCETPLEKNAYRFCLTHATPVNRLPHSHESLDGWCCSLEHARIEALNVLENEK
jgi:hypothetical protein